MFTALHNHGINFTSSCEFVTIKDMSQIVTANSRQALERAKLFLRKAIECPIESRVDFEAFLEASIIFARAAIHRIQSSYEGKTGFKEWWDSLLGDPSVNFFRIERNWILKDGPPKIGQRIIMPTINIEQKIGGLTPITDESTNKHIYASDLYYYEDPSIPATKTVEHHLTVLEKHITEFIETLS